MLRSDKESLETGLYEQQQLGNQLEAKKTTLEQDIQVRPHRRNKLGTSMGHRAPICTSL